MGNAKCFLWPDESRLQLLPCLFHQKEQLLKSSYSLFIPPKRATTQGQLFPYLFHQKEQLLKSSYSPVYSTKKSNHSRAAIPLFIPPKRATTQEQLFPCLFHPKEQLFPVYSTKKSNHSRAAIPCLFHPKEQPLKGSYSLFIPPKRATTQEQLFPCLFHQTAWHFTISLCCSCSESQPTFPKYKWNYLN